MVCEAQWPMRETIGVKNRSQAPIIYALIEACDHLIEASNKIDRVRSNEEKQPNEVSHTFTRFFL